MKVRVFKLRDIGYLILFLSIFKPVYAPSLLIYIYRVLQVVSFVYLGYKCISQKKISKELVGLVGLYYGLLFFATIIGRGNLHDLAWEVITSFGMVFWFQAVTGKNSKSCIKIALVAFEILIYINLISVILFPNGLYRTSDSIVSARYGWVLGHQSIFAMYAAPAVCVAALNWNRNLDLISAMRFVCITIACIMQILIFGSANNIVCIIVIAAGTWILSIRKTNSFPFAIVYIGVFILNILITVMQSYSFLEPIVVSFLHRTMTFTNRTSIWTRVISLILKKAWIGYGIQDANVVGYHLGTTHAHNQYLQCLYLGGIPLFVVFCLICFVSFRNLKRAADTFAGRVVISSVVALMIQMVFEVYFYNPMGKLLIVLSFYFVYLIDDANNRNSTFRLKKESGRVRIKW